MWFTIAVEEDSKLGLQGTLDVLQELTGAESIRQLPTLKLFKIRMDLEMEGGTEVLAKAAVAEDPVELEKQPYDEFDRAVIRATQGDMPVVPEPYADAARRARREPSTALLEHLEGMKERGILRRVAAILFHRRAGFSANGMGVWKVPEERIAELGPRMAAFRGISPLLPAPDLRRLALLGLHDGPRALQGGVRRDPRRDRRRDRRASRTARRSTRSTEFKKIRLLYFTDEFTPVGAGTRGVTVSLADTRSAELYARALSVLPGGVNSPVRAMRAIGRDPIFVDARRGRRDRRRRRQPLRRLRLLVGPAHPRPRAPGRSLAAVADGRGARARPSARRPQGEVELAEEVARPDRRRSRCCA